MFLSVFKQIHKLVFFWMILIVVIGCGICAVGLQRGVEKVTKVMMGLLLGVMLLLVVKSLSLDGAIKGVEFYLVPDFNLLMENGIFNAVYGAMGQAFFTLSIGMGEWLFLVVILVENIL